MPVLVTPPTVEDLAVDEQSLNLVHEAWRGFDGRGRDVFNNYLIGALVANLPAEQVEAAIRIAKSCCATAGVDHG